MLEKKLCHISTALLTFLVRARRVRMASSAVDVTIPIDDWNAFHSNFSRAILATITVIVWAIRAVVPGIEYARIELFWAMIHSRSACIWCSLVMNIYKGSSAEGLIRCAYKHRNSEKCLGVGTEWFHPAHLDNSYRLRTAIRMPENEWYCRQQHHTHHRNTK